MRRFVLFVFDPENPNGGWSDFHEAYENLEDALFAFRTVTEGFAQIIDLETFAVIRQKLRRGPEARLN